MLDVFGIAWVVYRFNKLAANSNALNGNEILVWTGLLITFFILKNIMVSRIIKKQADFAFNLAYEQSDRIFRNVYSQDELFFSRADTGSLISDMMYVPAAFSNGIVIGYIVMVTELLVLAFMVLFLIITTFKISLLVILFIGPAAFFIYRSIKNKIEALGHYKNTMSKKAQDILIQSLNARHDALVYNRSAYFESLFNQYEKNITSTDAATFTLSNIPSRLMEVFAVTALCMIYIFHRYIDPGTTLTFLLTVFAAAAFRLLPSVNRSLGAMLRIRNHWFSVDALIKYKDEIKQKEGNEVIRFNESIYIEDLVFSYNEKAVTKISSFTIHKGECMGISGDTGEGKSTFIQLLMQFLPAGSGSFYADGVKIDAHNTAAFRSLFAYIRQDVFILNASLQENISLSLEADNEKVNEIIDRLNLRSIEHLFKEESVAGEAGSRLSGGQKKMVALARALYFDKPVMVLDEVTASLDENAVSTVISILREEHHRGKTIILISHQKAIFEICDIVYRFKEGKLIPLVQDVGTI
jgi:ABC-type multidrug transport system fused ATPase/permease subunit